MVLKQKAQKVDKSFTLSPSGSVSPFLKAACVTCFLRFFPEIVHAYMCKWMYLYVYPHKLLLYKL